MIASAPRNLADSIFASARTAPDAPALLWNDGVLTYRELACQIRSMTKLLERRGIQSGDRVALLVYNQPAYVVAFFAVLSLGATVIPVNVRLTTREVAVILNDAGAQALITTHEFEPVWSQLTQTPLTQVVVDGVDELAEDAAHRAFEVVDFREGLKHLDSAQENGQQPVAVDETSVATLVYTSGTTGVPKGVMLSHQNIWADALANLEVIAATASDRFITISPLFHVFGQTNVLVSAMAVGAAVVLVKKFSPRKVLDAIQRHGVTFMAAVPTMYHMMLTHLKDHDYDLSTIRVCHSGAAAMPVELIERIETVFDAPVQEGYGLSEASSIVCSNPLHGTRKPGTVGLPIPGVAVRVVDEAMADVPSGTVGELLVQGPIVMQGYYNRPELTRAAFSEGWLRTKDLARMDEEGYVSIVDRKDDLINIGGVKVYPREIEEVLYGHPAIHAAVVIGEPSNLYHQEIKAFVVPESGHRPAPDAIYRYCKDFLAEYKIPKTFEFVDEIPKGPTGKILRKAFRQSG